jgi:hypothetical protein
MLVIKDGFFVNPHQVREEAIKSLSDQHKCLLNDDGDNYPGVRADIPDGLRSLLISSIETEIDRRVKSFDASYHLTTSAHGFGLAHQDYTRFAGLVYLNEYAPTRSGTIFYRLNRKPPPRIVGFREASTSKDVGIVTQFIGVKEQHNTQNFVEDFEVENQFNRLLIYEGTRPHSPGTYFGNTLQDSRLVLVFWFQAP